MTNKIVGRPFQKGQSGNPGGRPKIADDVKELARTHTGQAIERLVYWMDSEDAGASVRACTALLERGWGKAPQDINANLNSKAELIIRRSNGIVE